ncbi:hypothetical protein Taro_028967, partial [Colocasia esculenta]|nr:hypothetical protein [Colocasia esculenta]
PRRAQSRVHCYTEEEPPSSGPEGRRRLRRLPPLLLVLRHRRLLPLALAPCAVRSTTAPPRDSWVLCPLTWTPLDTVSADVAVTGIGRNQQFVGMKRYTYVLPIFGHGFKEIRKSAGRIKFPYLPSLHG